jgi:hypothetical protein
MKKMVRTSKQKEKRRRPRNVAAAKQRPAAAATGMEQGRDSERSMPGTAQQRMPRQGLREITAERDYLS